MAGKRSCAAARGADRSELLREVQPIVAEHAGRAPQEIREQDHLEHDLGLDSLDQVEIVMALEERFEIDVPDEVASEVRTVGDIVDCVLRLQVRPEEV